MHDQALVSILINNYNYERYLSDSIQSALSQTYKPLEIVVVDDGSQDRSAQVIASYHDRILAVAKPNGGQASAFNAGFAACSGDIICFLDADDHFNSDKVEQVVKLFSDYPTAQWLFHELEDVNETGETLSIDRPKLQSTLEFQEFQPLIRRGGVLPYMPATSGLVFHRSLLSKILPMPEAFRISADSYLRLAALCLEPGIVSSQEFAVHRMHGSNLYEGRKDVNAAKARVDIQSAYYLLTKYCETRFFCNRLFAHALGKLMATEGVRGTWTSTDVQLYLNSVSRLDWLKLVPRTALSYLRSPRILA